VNYPTSKQFIRLTNEGAHFSTVSHSETLDRKALQILLKLPQTPTLTQYLVLLKAVSHGPVFKHLMSLFSKGYLCAINHAIELTSQPLETSLPLILKQLSDENHCALADQEGFLLAHCGFNLNQAEQAAILAVEISGLQTKRLHNIQGVSSTDLSFISIIDDNGKSQLRFWPIHFNHQVLLLAIKGKPILENTSFIQLTWQLGQRYL